LQLEIKSHTKNLEGRGLIPTPSRFNFIFLKTVFNLKFFSEVRQKNFLTFFRSPEFF